MTNKKLVLPYVENAPAKFILYSARVDGISYHKRGLDNNHDAQDWPMSADTDTPVDARVFDSANADDCKEAIKRILAHGYFVVKVKG